MRKVAEIVGVGEGEKKKEFNLFLEEMEVDDMPVVGRKFTWYRPNGEARWWGGNLHGIGQMGRQEVQ